MAFCVVTCWGIAFLKFNRGLSPDVPVLRVSAQLANIIH